MSVVLFVVVFAALVAWRLLRRRRTDRLAGLDSGRPTFTAAPPTRSPLGRKDFRL